jgi:hypothetical protein
VGLRTPRNMEVTESHREIFSSSKFVEGVHLEVSAYPSAFLARLAFQACSFNHSDISPFRINDLLAPAADYRTRRPLFPARTPSPLYSVV